MRICLISNYDSLPDEGQKKIAVSLQQELEKKHQVLHINVRHQMRASGRWQELRHFHPDIVHSLLRPSASSLLAAGAIRLYSHPRRTVLSAVQPAIESPLYKAALAFFSPALVLPLSRETEAYFSRQGHRVHGMPVGVDTGYFTPANPEEKIALRHKYGIDAKAFVILHVGHMTRGRNLPVLNKLNTGRNLVLLVASPAFTPDPAVYRSLIECKCTIWRKYIENIREVYALADCYVFPTESRSHAVEMPLSVMEAMSCNLPVVTVPFAALPRFFTPGEGLFFTERVEDIPQAVEATKEMMNRDASVVQTRRKVLPFSWKRAGEELETIYEQLLVEAK